MMPPGKFIPVAERSGLPLEIHGVGREILHQRSAHELGEARLRAGEAALGQGRDHPMAAELDALAAHVEVRDPLPDPGIVDG